MATKFNFSNRIDHIFIIGAGASVDYGLPVWKKLASLIKSRVSNKECSHKKEILEWVSKVGTEGGYGTIDECISRESINYRSNGHVIENQIFSIIKDIFNESYKDNEKGWITALNRKILDTEGNLADKIGFINYNYDDVLDRNFLNFSNLSEKEKIWSHKSKLSILSNTIVSILYPHGKFYKDIELVNYPNFHRTSTTIKSGDENYIDAVSCFDSEKYDIERIGTNYSKTKLYIMGLGGGLKMNLSKLNFVDSVSEVNVTIKDESMTDEIVDFLSKRFNLAEIKIYKDCDELIKKCF
jgi:hypothetical protein